MERDWQARADWARFSLRRIVALLLVERVRLRSDLSKQISRRSFSVRIVEERLERSLRVTLMQENLLLRIRLVRVRRP